MREMYDIKVFGTVLLREFLFRTVKKLFVLIIVLLQKRKNLFEQ